MQVTELHDISAARSHKALGERKVGKRLKLKMENEGKVRSRNL